MLYAPGAKVLSVSHNSVVPFESHGVVVDVLTSGNSYRVRFIVGALLFYEDFSEADLIPEAVWSAGMMGVSVTPLLTVLEYYGDTSAPCPHSWTTYTGLSKKYEFCLKCDEKRNERGIYD